MKIKLLEVPLDYGASRRGVNMGPTALRLAGLREALQGLGHTVEEDPRPFDVNIQEHEAESNPHLKYLPAITRVCRTLAERVEESLDQDAFPLVMGGDHSIAIGTLAGASSHCRKKNLSLGVLWIDAHGDFNTPETSPSGNIHGMPLAASVGLGHHTLTNLHGDFQKVAAENVVILGLRDLDPGEKQNLKDEEIKTFTMADVDRHGISVVVQRALEYLTERVDFLHVSFDVDSLDPEFAPGVGTPVRGGLQYREAHLLMELLCESHLVRSLEVVEVNPILDIRNQTAVVAVEMVASLLGDTIL